MYDVSPDFMNQLAADRRESLRRTGAASSRRAPLRRGIAAFVARLRRAPGRECGGAGGSRRNAPVDPA